MKVILLSVISAAMLAAAGPEDVIRLCQAGMSQEVVVAAAKQQPATNLTADQMIAVKAACKSDQVLLALMQPPAVHAAAPTTPTPMSNIFLVTNGQKIALKAEALQRSGWKKGLGGLGALATASPKMLGEIRGEQAEVRTSSRRPEFLLPGDAFLLVRLDEKQGHRESVVGAGGLLGSRGGFEKKKLQDFNFSAGRVTFSQALERGEYAFYPADAFEASGESDLKLTSPAFTFGVD